MCHFYCPTIIHTYLYHYIYSVNFNSGFQLRIMLIVWFSAKIKTHNYNQYPLLYKIAEFEFGQILECQRWYVYTQTVVTIGHCAPSGIIRIYQATHSYLYYNLYICIRTYVHAYIIAICIAIHTN